MSAWKELQMLMATDISEMTEEELEELDREIELKKWEVLQNERDD